MTSVATTIKGMEGLLRAHPRAGTRVWCRGRGAGCGAAVTSASLRCFYE